MTPLLDLRYNLSLLDRNEKASKAGNPLKEEELKRLKGIKKILVEKKITFQVHTYFSAIFCKFFFKKIFLSYLIYSTTKTVS